MRDLIKISRAIIKEAQAGSFQATISNTQSSQSESSAQGPHQNTKAPSKKNKMDEVVTPFYDVENPVDHLVPGGINAY